MQYRREDGCRAWLQSAMIGVETLTGLMREYGGAEGIYALFEKRRESVLNDRLTGLQLEKLRQNAAPEVMNGMVRLMRDEGIGILFCDDAAYPAALQEIPDPPALLFYQGSLMAAEGRCLTIIGTRSPTAMTLSETEKIARELSDAGVAIVSGLAPGIDTAAHEGCLRGRSPAIGVCACGLDMDYPAISSALKRRIVEKGGLLLSEFPLGMKSAPWCFEPRNRILSGLSRGVVMMEGRIKSGSMLTVNSALNQGREVFAYPGQPTSAQSEGAHQLIREGARYFTTAADLLEDLSWDDHPQPTAKEREALPEVSPAQKRILSELARGDLSMDELAAATGLDAAEISVALTLMQMMGLIRALPGKRYARL